MSQIKSDETSQLFEPVEKRRLFEDVLAQLEKLIKSGHLQPGDRLPAERTLSTTLQVGRHSLREALRVLEAMGIISVKTGVGAAAGSIINREVGPAIARLMSLYMALGHFTLDDLLELDRDLGASAIRRACERVDETTLAPLAERCQEMSDAATRRSAYLRLNARFSVDLSIAAGNRLAAHLVAAIREPIQEPLMASNVKPADWTKFVSEAQPLVEAIVAGIQNSDAEAALDAYERHTDLYSKFRTDHGN